MVPLFQMPVAKNRSRDRIPLMLAIGLGGALAIAAAALALLRFYHFGNNNFDLAFYTRVVWGMAHGDRVNSIVGAHDLGLHFMPLMFLFVPLAHLFPIPETLLISQALALGAVAPLLHSLGARVTGRPWFGLVLAATWCIHPSTLHIGAKEFHPGSLALPLLVAAFDALHAQKNKLASLLLFVALLTREEVALVTAGAGAALLLERGRRRMGALLLAVGVCWFLTYILLIQPAFLPQRGSMEAHFPGCGHSAGQIMGYLLTHPMELLRRTFGPEKLTCLGALLLSFAALPLLGPRWLPAWAAPLAVNLVSEFPASRDITSHYVTLVLPGLFMSATAGLGVLLGKPDEHGAGPRKRVFLTGAAALLLAATAGHIVCGATPLSRTWNAAPYKMNRAENLLSWYAQDILAEGELSVMAPSAALGHLAERSQVYSHAYRQTKPDVAILRIAERRWAHLDPTRFDTPMERAIQRLDADPAYGTWRLNPPFRVVRRGVPGGRERVDGVSLFELPSTARRQEGGWPGYIDLVGLEASLKRISEPYSGRYNEYIAVRTTFYWQAQRELPERLFLRVVIEGDTKTHTVHYLPSWGIRDTSTWRRNEIIRDEQRSESPGGWPLEALKATVQFVRSDGTPYPKHGDPVTLAW